MSREIFWRPVQFSATSLMHANDKRAAGEKIKQPRALRSRSGSRHSQISRSTRISAEAAHAGLRRRKPRALSSRSGSRHSQISRSTRISAEAAHAGLRRKKPRALRSRSGSRHSLVPVAGFEPAWNTPPHFECGASASFATPAGAFKHYSKSPECFQEHILSAGTSVSVSGNCPSRQAAAAAQPGRE